MRSLFSVISVTQTDALRKKTTEIIQNDMASLILFLILAVCLAVLHRGIDSAATTAAAVPVQETCTVSTVTEGEPAVMTFKLRSGIDTASETFFAHLRRSDHKLKDIVTCDGAKYVACDVKSGHPMFQVDDNIKENVLTVRISNMSHELEDTYVLQVYFNKTTEPQNICTLNITYTQTTPKTVTGDENGSKGWIPALIICLLLLLIIVIGLLIWKKNPNCWQECKRRLPFKADHYIPDTPRSDDHEQQKSLMGTTTQPVSSPKPGNTSSLSDNYIPDTPRSDDHEQQKSVMGTTPQPVPSPKPGNTSSLSDNYVPDTPRSDDHEQQKSVMGTTPQPVPPPNPGNTSSLSDKTPEQISSHEGMRWFIGYQSDDEVKKLFERVKPRAGRFVITQSKADPSSFSLFVCGKGWEDQGKVNRVYITQNDSGFIVNVTKAQFKTLCELVNVYKNEPMHVGGKDLGTLSKPCEEEPKDAWYVGSLNGDKVWKLLFTEHTKEGSFLVAKSSTNEDNYTLSVQFGGKRVPFTIFPRDEGFKIINMKVPFMTLQKLVEHYKTNDLDGRGKLTTPLEIIPEELTTKEKQILEKHGPGSYFFKDSVIPSRRVLAVNANGKMKQLMITKSNDGYILADHAIPHTDEVALGRSYKTKELSLHGERYGYLQTNCTHDLEKNLEV